MNSRLSSRLFRLGASVLLAACSLSCASNQDFLIITNAVWMDDGCGFSGSDSVAVMMVDSSFDGQIGIGVVVSNELAKYNFSNTGIDDTEVVLETAEVSLSFSGGGVSSNVVEVPIPSNSVFGGDETIVLVRVPSDVVASLADTMSNLPADSIETLEMEIVIKGHRSQFGDRKLGAIKTRPFVFPFDVCFGCLATCGFTPGCGFAQGVCPDDGGTTG